MSALKLTYFNLCFLSICPNNYKAFLNYDQWRSWNLNFLINPFYFGNESQLQWLTHDITQVFDVNLRNMVFIYFLTNSSDAEKTLRIRRVLQLNIDIGRFETKPSDVPRI